jgi:hypothetical protein
MTYLHSLNKSLSYIHLNYLVFTNRNAQAILVFQLAFQQSGKDYQMLNKLIFLGIISLYLPFDGSEQ